MTIITITTTTTKGQQGGRGKFSKLGPTCKECAGQVIWITSLSTMRPKRKRIQPLGLSKFVQDVKIRIQVVRPVCVRRVVLVCPILWLDVIEIASIRLRFIVNHVESDQHLQEQVELGMTRWILGHLHTYSLRHCCRETI